jgi:hypothetical protein
MGLNASIAAMLFTALKNVNILTSMSQVLRNGIIGMWPTAKCWYHFPPFAKNLQPATFYFMSRQFGPAFKSTTRGTASSRTCSIALRTSGRRRSSSLWGASNSSSSWTCRIILA